MNRTALILVAGTALMVAGVFLALRLASDRSASDVPAYASSKEDIERIVKNYLLENPEVIFEAVKQMEVKENSQRLSQMREGAKSHAAELFFAPDAIVAGNPSGDVTIVEFFDYRCTYCRKIVPEISELLKQDGNIRLILKDFPILSKESEIAARAAVASVTQGKYWDFHMALMSAEELSDDAIYAIAKGVGLDVERLKTDMANAKVNDAIVRNHKLARDLGIEATPTFYIGDTPFSGALPLSELKDAVAAARKAKKA
ncbi:MAG: DsbA family protein [Micropepsaceae bacterium]